MVDKLTEQAIRGVEAVNMLSEERNQLRHDFEKAKVDMAMMNQRIHTLETSLRLATAERDHYMRYSTELTARLNNIGSMCLGAIELAKTGAYRPNNPAVDMVKLSHDIEKDADEIAKIIDGIKRINEDENDFAS